MKLVHLSLQLDQRSKLCLQNGNFLSQLLCLGCGGLDLGCQLLNLGLLVGYLGGLGQLLDAVCLLGGISW